MYPKMLDTAEKYPLSFYLLGGTNGSICKVPTSKTGMSVRWVRWFLLIITVLLADLVPAPSYAQLSQETLNLLSEQDQVAQQQLSGQNQGGEISLFELGENSLGKSSLVKTPDSCLALDSFAVQGSCGEVLLETAVTETFLANQVSPSKCTSYYANYGCYAIESQGGGTGQSRYATANGSFGPTASDLNAQERNIFFFSADPPGTWLQTTHSSFSNNRRDFNEFAVGAAKVINDWKSPVFFDINQSAGIGGSAIAVLESITINTYNRSSNTLASLCGPYGFNNKQADVRNVASTCEFYYGDDRNFGFDVASIDIAYWLPTGRVDQSYSGSNLSNFILNNFNNSLTNTYVWDPPETTEAAEPVPEPSSALGLLTFGLFATASFVKRKRK